MPGMAVTPAGEGGKPRRKKKGGYGSKLTDTNIASYFQDLEQHLASLDDEEEVQMLVDSALEEAQGQELKVVTDAVCSRVMESLLSAATGPQVISLLKSLLPDLAEAATNLFGSHVLETLLASMWKSLLVPSEEFREEAEAVLEDLCAQLVAHPTDIICDKAGSHVARQILAVVSGRDVCEAMAGGGKRGGHGPPSRGRKLASRLGTGGGGGGDSQPSFQGVLHRLTRDLLDAVCDDMAALRVDPYASPFLQALLAATEGTPHVTAVVAHVLGCPKGAKAAEGKQLKGSPADEVAALLRERSGSHVMEAVLRAAPGALLAEIYKRFFRGSLLELAKHPSANYTVQALASATKDGAQVQAMLGELEAHFGDLIRGRRAGVVAAVLAACGRLRVSRKEACRALANGIFSMQPGGPDPKSLASSLMSLDTLEGGGPAQWQHSRMSVLGCALLTTVLGFPQDCCQRFTVSLSGAGADELAAACADPAGSRAVEAFLQGESAHSTKRAFVRRLFGRYGEMALSPAGSHCVERLFLAGDVGDREAIATEVGAVEKRLEKERHGPILLRKCGVAQLARRPEEWRAQQEARSKSRGQFEELFGGARGDAGGGGGGAGAEAARAPGGEAAGGADLGGGASAAAEAAADEIDALFSRHTHGGKAGGAPAPKRKRAEGGEAPGAPSAGADAGDLGLVMAALESAKSEPKRKKKGAKKAKGARGGEGVDPEAPKKKKRKKAKKSRAFQEGRAGKQWTF